MARRSPCCESDCKENTMRRALGLAAALTALAVTGPAAAEAATITTEVGIGPQGPFYEIYYEAAPGEDNDLIVYEDLSGNLTFNDLVPLSGDCSPGLPGAPTDTTARTCPAAAVTHLSVAVGDGDNEVQAPGSDHALEISGLGAEHNSFDGSPHDDVLIGSNNDDQLKGQNGADVIVGNGGSDDLYGHGGNDDLQGGAGTDLMQGGEGGDDMSGGAGSDTVDYYDAARDFGVSVNLDLLANDGADLEHDNVNIDVENVLGTDHADTLTAHPADVTNGLFGRGGHDELSGGGGHDTTLAGGAGIDQIAGGNGNDLLYGGPGPDTLSGGTDNDVLSGEEENDYLVGGPGADVQFGGTGQDTANYASSSVPVTVDLDGVADDGAVGENDRVGGDVERISGGSAGDTLAGNDLANVIRGGSGDDEIVGNGGGDELYGEYGVDTLRSADGAIDTVFCGPDTDSFQADGLDILSGCETNLSPAPANPGQPADPGQPANPGQPPQPAQAAAPVIAQRIGIAPRRLRLSRRGVARLRLTCPPGAGQQCAGTLRLKRGRRTLAARRFSIAAGKSGSVSVRLSRRARRAIPRPGLSVRVVVSARDSALLSTQTLRILPGQR
jgi:Ca2+-binding RTX toxin-like protein